MVRLSNQQFDDWLKKYCFRTLKTGQKVGPQFCHDHKLVDFLLLHAYDNERAIEYIKQCYIA